MRAEDIVITKIIEDPKEFSDLLDAGVKADFFYERRNLFNFLHSQYSRFGVIPPLDVVKLNYPEWEPLPHASTMEFWLDQLRRDKSLYIQNGVVETWLEYRKTEKDPDKLAEVLVSGVSDIMNTSITHRDLNLNDIEREKRDYLDKKTSEVQRGYPVGLSRFDTQTGGAKAGDLGVLMGPPENFKTWLLCYMAHHIWTDSEVPGLLISKEMFETDLRDRMTWLDFRFNFTAFDKGILGDEIEKRYFDALERRKTRPEFIITGDDGEFDKGSGVSLVRAKVDRYQPKVVFVDGAYLLSDDRGDGDWKATRNVFRDLKRLARLKGIPIIVTTQPQRLKEADGRPLKRRLIQEDVGSSWTIAQDADFMIGVRKKAPEVLDIYKIKMRRGKDWSHQLLFNLDSGEIREMEDHEDVLEEEETAKYA